MSIKSYIGKKKVCVVGHNGYVGSTLHNSLLDNGVVVTKIDDLDISNPNDPLWELFEIYRFDVIFWLASADLSSIPSNMKEKDIDGLLKERDVNCDSLLYLHKALNGQTPTIVFTSSTNIYGDVSEKVVSENTNENPQTLWQSHKILSENYIKILFPNSISLRIPNIFGIIPNYSNENTYFRPVVNKVIRWGIEKRKLMLYKNKSCFRDYLHIYDLIEALLLAGLQKSTEKRYYNLGCDNSLTIEDTWNIIAECLNNIPIEYDDRELSDMETRSFTSDYTEFKKLTGWNPKYTLRYGIEESIEQIKKVINDSTVSHK